MNQQVEKVDPETTISWTALHILIIEIKTPDSNLIIIIILWGELTFLDGILLDGFFSV